MSKKPSLLAYAVKERDKGQKSIWKQIGAAWPHAKGGNGFTIELDALPLDGRIVLMEPKADDKAASFEADAGDE